MGIEDEMKMGGICFFVLGKWDFFHWELYIIFQENTKKVFYKLTLDDNDGGSCQIIASGTEVIRGNIDNCSYVNMNLELPIQIIEFSTK